MAALPNSSLKASNEPNAASIAVAISALGLLPLLGVNEKK